jgi:hypothetical protein
MYFENLKLRVHSEDQEEDAVKGKIVLVLQLSSPPLRRIGEVEI